MKYENDKIFLILCAIIVVGFVFYFFVTKGLLFYIKMII